MSVQVARCSACGYDIVDLDDGSLCPECGAEAVPRAPSDLAEWLPLVVLYLIWAMGLAGWNLLSVTGAIEGPVDRHVGAFAALWFISFLLSGIVLTGLIIRTGTAPLLVWISAIAAPAVCLLAALMNSLLLVGVLVSL